MSEFEKAVTGLGEECGVFGAYDMDGHDVAASIYYGLFALQHRGQESCGIAVTDTAGKRKVLSRKGLGHVNDVFDEKVLSELKGNLGVGHVRYSTAGGTRVENAQPLVINYVKGTLAIAHNGNLVNAIELRKELEYTGAIFQTTIDSEVIAYHIARERLEAIRLLHDLNVGMVVRLALDSRAASGMPCKRASEVFRTYDAEFLDMLEHCGVDLFGLGALLAREEDA